MIERKGGRERGERVSLTSVYRLSAGSFLAPAAQLPQILVKSYGENNESPERCTG